MDLAQSEALADRLLLVLRKRQSSFFEIGVLSKTLKAEPADIDTAVDVLLSWGYRLNKRMGNIVLTDTPDSLTDTEIMWGLKTKAFGQKVHAYQSVKSTNDIAAKLAEQGAPEGTIVTAEQQTKGRGRFRRVWHSPPGTGIYVSMVLKPRFKPAKAPALSIMTAVALADAISEYLPGQVFIKWPNDILIGNRDRGRLRKCSGILMELSAETDRINHVIVGVGVNVNQRLNDFPEDLRKLASSIRRLKQRKVRRVELLQRFLVNFEKEYEAYKQHGLKKIHSKVRSYSSLIGKTITLASGKRTTEGKVIDIDLDGCLIYECDGEQRPVTAGEVTVVRR